MSAEVVRLSSETLQAEVDELRQELKDFSNSKDEYLATYRAKARKLNDTVDAKAAELVAAEAVEQMSDAERQAIGVELAKMGDG